MTLSREDLSRQAMWSCMLNLLGVPHPLIAALEAHHLLEVALLPKSVDTPAWARLRVLATRIRLALAAGDAPGAIFRREYEATTGLVVIYGHGYWMLREVAEGAIEGTARRELCWFDPAEPYATLWGKGVILSLAPRLAEWPADLWTMELAHAEAARHHARAAEHMANVGPREPGRYQVEATRLEAAPGIAPRRFLVTGSDTIGMVQ